MNRSLAEIADDALALPQSEQLELARALLERVETSGDQDQGADAAWKEEIERRVALIDAGLAKGRPFADVLRDIDRRFAK